MDRPTCKLCSRTFSNGRALGGHMRSHMAEKRKQTKIQSSKIEEAQESALSSSSSEGVHQRERIEGQKEKVSLYGLRGNPRKNFRLIDPEFVNAGSIVQDRESESESNKNEPFRRRSKRRRSRSNFEPEQLSSISDEIDLVENVAISLMMLKRDSWDREVAEDHQEIEESDGSAELKFSAKYQCETCKKMFNSYQALGGHKASHKKIKVPKNRTENLESSNFNYEQKNFECPICFRVFVSGQALGGHKRSHFSTSISTSPIAPTRLCDNLIDLNLPVVDEDEQQSQIEISALSDAEFDVPEK